jgi:hypothetical protein
MKIFSVPYRWLPRTIFPNISWIFQDIYYGFKNVIRWTPVIWFDSYGDWTFLATVMEYKLRRMSKLMKHSYHINADKVAKRLLICAELSKKLIADEYIEPLTKANIYRDMNRKKEGLIFQK